MPYEFLPEAATADIAFHASGKDLPELFISAGDALMNVMIDNLESIAPRQSRTIGLENEELDMLLFDTLQEQIYYKDAEQLLLRFTRIEISESNDKYYLQGKAEGETLDPSKHLQRADVKAVTLHQFTLAKTIDGWEAAVVLDI